MRQPFRPEDSSASLQALQTRRLIADIRRVIDILGSDIAAEEASSGVSDTTKAEYPILARTLAARRENLQSTVALLHRRLDDLSRPAAHSPDATGTHQRLPELA